MDANARAAATSDALPAGGRSLGRINQSVGLHVSALARSGAALGKPQLSLGTVEYSQGESATRPAGGGNRRRYRQWRFDSIGWSLLARMVRGGDVLEMADGGGGEPPGHRGRHARCRGRRSMEACASAPPGGPMNYTGASPCGKHPECPASKDDGSMEGSK